MLSQSPPSPSHLPSFERAPAAPRPLTYAPVPQRDGTGPLESAVVSPRAALESLAALPTRADLEAISAPDARRVAELARLAATARVLHERVVAAASVDAWHALAPSLAQLAADAATLNVAARGPAALGRRP